MALKIFRNLVSLGLAVSLLASTSVSADSALGLAAKVNGVAISAALLERSFEEYLRDNNINVASIRYPKRLKEFKKEVLDLLIDAELLWQEANKTDTVVTDSEVETAVARVRQQFKSDDDFARKISAEGYTKESYFHHVKRMVTARSYLDRIRQQAQEPTQEQVHQFYVDNPEKFNMPPLVRARHILLQTNATMDEKQLQQIKAKATELADKIRKGADFAALAREHSQDKSAAQGGDLGYFPRGQMVKPFEDAVFALKPGQVSDVVKTRYGLHIVKLEETRDAAKVSEADATDQIRAFLGAQNLRLQEQKEIQRLRGQAQIEVYTVL
ncbi:MAG: peptidylprolyl isomerase [Gammaproteobacteria bacterium]|nr:peptidylprolyl isomerase [Gammaproteobacteria bacterium]MDH5799959.1 peptidylprolyl isomerase [Gammaproteobacteria bacterium]